MRAHRNAFMADLESRLAGSVFSSYSAADQSRYAVVFTGLSRRDQHRYSGPQGRSVFTFTVHSVGASEEQALWVAERVNMVTDRVLEVPGRSLWPVEYVTGVPPDLDDDGPSPLWWVVSQFDVVSDPA